MPLYMDVHHGLEKGLTPEVLAALHQNDLSVQAKHGVRYLKYWYDPRTGRAFCLSEAPSPEAVMAVHPDAHPDAPGILADEIFQVFEGE